MLIISKSRSSRRHDRSLRAEDSIRYRLQKGAAQVALDHKRERPMTDPYGKPLPLSTGMAAGHSEKGLERLVHQGKVRQ